MRRKLSLPRGWNRHVRKSVLQILSLAWYTFISVRGWATQSRSLPTCPSERVRRAGAARTYARFDLDATRAIFRP
ncbi:MAG: hypothetical protein O7H41_00645 [Planctomycetota bacterium]|nr:hypothetical protein [Planctomycetota bacterium]